MSVIKRTAASLKNQPYSEYMEGVIRRTYSEGGLPAIDMSQKQYTPLAFSTLPDDKDPIFLGWEWEVRDNNNKANVMRAAKEFPELFYYINAGSDAGMEMRSVPASLAYHKQEAKRLIQDTGFQNSFTCRMHNGCGIHIHIDKKTAFGWDSTKDQEGNKEAAERFKKFISFYANPGNAYLIDLISGRMEGQSCRAPNPVATFVKDNKGKITGSDIVIVAGNRTFYRGGCPGRGNSVNTQTNDGTTVELRMFNSVKTVDQLLAKLDFAEATARFCSSDFPYEQMYAEDFAKYVVDNEDKYYHLLNKSEALVPFLP